MKTITIKKIPFPTWEEFEKGQRILFTKRPFNCGIRKISIDTILSYIDTSYWNQKSFLFTKQGYTEACEFLQAEWEKLIESMASLCEGE